MTELSPYPPDPRLIQKVMDPSIKPIFFQRWLPTVDVNPARDTFTFTNIKLYPHPFIYKPDDTWKSEEAEGEGIISLYARLNDIKDAEEAEQYLTLAIQQNFSHFIRPQTFIYHDKGGNGVFTKTYTHANLQPRITMSQKIDTPAGIPLYLLPSLLALVDDDSTHHITLLPNEFDVLLANFRWSTTKNKPIFSTTGRGEQVGGEKFFTDFSPLHANYVTIIVDTARHASNLAFHQAAALYQKIIHSGNQPLSIKIGISNPYVTHRALWGTKAHYRAYWKQMRYFLYPEFKERYLTPHEGKKNEAGDEPERTKSSPKKPAAFPGETTATQPQTPMAYRRTTPPKHHKKNRPDIYPNEREGSQTGWLDFDSPKCPIKPLGLKKSTPDKGIIFLVVSKRSGEIFELTYSSFTESYLDTLGESEWWSAWIGPQAISNKSKKWYKIVGKAIRNECTRRFQQRGSHLNIDEKKAGRGVYFLGNNRYVANLGSNAYIDVRDHENKSLRTDLIKPYDIIHPKFYFETDESIDIYMNAPQASEQERQTFMNLCEMPNWGGNIHTYSRLFAGWCALAPFSGALDWKPHLFIYGPAGSGKSTIRQLIAEKAIGNWAFNVQGSSTEAGIRRGLDKDARPLIHDEADQTEAIKGKAQESTIDKLFKLARVSSSESEGLIRHGDGKVYRIRSMMLMIDISPRIREAADVTRILQLAIRSPQPDQQEKNDQRIKEYIRLSDSLQTHYTVDDIPIDFASRLFSFMWRQRANIRPTIELFIRQLGFRLHQNNRFASLFAPMVAGAWILEFARQPTEEEAGRYISRLKLDGFIELTEYTDHLALLDYILGLPSNLRGNFGETETIAELIQQQYSYHVSDPADPTEANKSARRLSRLGFRIHLDWLIVANRTSFLDEALKGVNFGKNIRETLSNIPGSTKPANSKGKETPISFGGSSSRAIQIPIKFVLDRIKDE